MKNMQPAAIVLIASTLSLGIAASSTAFAADAMHGDAMHKGMKKHKAMMKKESMHKDTMRKDADQRSDGQQRRGRFLLERAARALSDGGMPEIEAPFSGAR